MACVEAENALTDYVDQLERQGAVMSYGNRVIAMLRMAIVNAKGTDDETE